MEYEIDADESTSVEVSKAIDKCTEAYPRDTETLHEVVDPDALDAIFVPIDEDTPRSSGRISFIFRGCRVTVIHGEYLTITPVTMDEIPQSRPKL